MKFSATFHDGKNYGAFLQSFALSEKAESSLIDCAPNFVGPRAKKKLPFVWPLLAAFRWFRYKTSPKFPEFCRLSRTKKIYSLKSISKLGFSPSDTFIAGSDQIWNPQFITGRENFYFLAFAPEGSRRISYAASLGVKSWPKDFVGRVLPLLKKFDAISVREESSVEYLTSLGLKNVVCVCDPTILHRADFYRKEFPYSKESADFAFVYKIREILPAAVAENLPADVRTVDLAKKRTIVSVTEWLRNVDNACFVVTDSFHCAVFCILFHKPFVVIPNRSTGKGMNERFATLLGNTGLEYRVLTCDESVREVREKLFRAVDWESIDRIMEEWRTRSAAWLEAALGGAQ